MGKRKGQNHGKRRFQRQKVNDGKTEMNDGRDNPSGFNDWVYTNERFVKFYQIQGLIKEEEWDAFMEHLARPLPTSFRINHSCLFRDQIALAIKEEFHFKDLVIDDEKVDPIRSIDWYPGGNGFQWSLDKRKIRKLPELQKFQKWLVSLSESGNITRQEVVSMIPPLVLGVQPHHRVLDMCAAPGSKTCQLIELIHAEDGSQNRALPTGIVVANDADYKRANLLVHQCKRLSSPALLITCHKAQQFPIMGHGEEGSQFDRILCDVPCSGDGTMRKNPDIWQKWSPKNGLALHSLQLQIAKRGIQLLKKGGLMCYSTCTFNPMENEAVVAELLRWSNGAIELLDVSGRLPHLKRRPGVSDWKVVDKNMRVYEAFHEAIEDKSIVSTMFPPTKDEANEMHLEHCMRCVPHDSDTGGFFICLFKKSGELDKMTFDVMEKASDAVVDISEHVNFEQEKEEVKDKLEPAVEPATETVSSMPMLSEKRKDIQLRDERKVKDYFRRLPMEQAQSIKDFYGLNDSFPLDQLYTRSDEGGAVTFVTEALKTDLVEGLQDSKLKIIHSGVRLFDGLSPNTPSPCPHRLAQNSVHILRPYISKRWIEVSPLEFSKLVEHRGILFSFSDFSESVCKKLEESAVGSVVFNIDLHDDKFACISTEQKRMLNLVVWRGKSSVSSMVSIFDHVTLISTLKALDLFVSSPAPESTAVKKAKAAEAEGDESKFSVATPETIVT